MSSREEVSAKYLTDYRSMTTEVDIYTVLFSPCSQTAV